MLENLSAQLPIAAPGAWIDLPATRELIEERIGHASRLSPHLPAGVRTAFAKAVDHAKEPVTDQLHARSAVLEIDEATTFRDFCYQRQVAAGREGVAIKFRQEHRAWTAGIHISGIGSVLVSQVSSNRPTVQFHPVRHTFFLDSFRDDRRVVHLMQSIWGHTYCADKIAYAGKGVASVKPFDFNGSQWIITACVSGGGDPPYGEAWRLQAATSWPQRTYNYVEHGTAQNEGLIERGDYRGLIVRVRKAMFVLERGMVVVGNRVASRVPAAAPTKIAAPIEASLDVDGCTLYPGARCVIDSVHHQVFEKDLGKHVVVSKLAGNIVWTHDDADIRYRVNRAGRRVVAYDPKNVLTARGGHSLKLRSE